MSSQKALQTANITLSPSPAGADHEHGEPWSPITGRLISSAGPAAEDIPVPTATPSHVARRADLPSLPPVTTTRAKRRATEPARTPSPTDANRERGEPRGFFSGCLCSSPPARPAAEPPSITYAPPPAQLGSEFPLLTKYVPAATQAAIRAALSLPLRAAQGRDGMRSHCTGSLNSSPGTVSTMTLSNPAPLPPYSPLAFAPMRPAAPSYSTPRASTNVASTKPATPASSAAQRALPTVVGVTRQHGGLSGRCDPSSTLESTQGQASIGDRIGSPAGNKSIFTGDVSSKRGVQDQAERFP
jgi:hypothetical protein